MIWLWRLMDLNEMLAGIDAITRGISTRGSYFLHALAAFFLTIAFGFMVIAFDLGSTLYVVEQYQPTIDNAFVTNPVLRWISAGQAQVGGFAVSSLIIICLTLLPSLSQIFLLRGVAASCLIGMIVKLSIAADLWTDFPGMHATLGGWPQATTIPFLSNGGLPPGVPISAIASDIYSDTITTTVVIGGIEHEALMFTPTITDYVVHGFVTVISTLFVSVSAQICLVGSFVLFITSIAGGFGIKLVRRG